MPWHAPTIDFARWLKSRFKPSDYVVLKLDVDGSEWRVLPHLEAANVTSLLDEVYVEWHTDDMGITQTYGVIGLARGLWPHSSRQTADSSAVRQGWRATSDVAVMEPYPTVEST